MNAPPSPNTADPQLLLRRHIEHLVNFGHRGAATDHERRAGEYLSQELQNLGFTVIRQPFRGARSMASRLLPHMLVCTAGLFLLWRFPTACATLAAIALISLVAEQMTRGTWLGRLAKSHPSFNVVATLYPASPARRLLVVSAHYDTQRAAWIWSLRKPFERAWASAPPVL